MHSTRIPAAADGAATFTTYGASHLAVLAILLVGVVALVWAGRRFRTADPDDRLGKAMAIAALALTVPLQVLYFTPGYWDLAKTLPIQLCDLASFAAIYALWTHRWWATGLVYYWGLTLTTQAIITPDLASAFPDPVFFLYWGMHLLIVWAAVYLVWGRGIVPTWRTYGFAVALTTVWAVSVYTFNVRAGTNYGYLNAKPQAASALDLLGDWPTYVVVEIALVITVWALITWPWTVRSRPADEGGSRGLSPASARGLPGPRSPRARRSA